MSGKDCRKRNVLGSWRKTDRDEDDWMSDGNELHAEERCSDWKCASTDVLQRLTAVLCRRWDAARRVLWRRMRSLQQPLHAAVSDDSAVASSGRCKSVRLSACVTHEHRALVDCSSSDCQATQTLDALLAILRRYCVTRGDSQLGGNIHFINSQLHKIHKVPDK